MLHLPSRGMAAPSSLHTPSVGHGGEDAAGAGALTGFHTTRCRLVLLFVCSSVVMKRRVVGASPPCLADGMCMFCSHIYVLWLLLYGGVLVCVSVAVVAL